MTVHFKDSSNSRSLDQYPTIKKEDKEEIEEQRPSMLPRAKSLTTTDKVKERRRSLDEFTPLVRPIEKSSLLGRIRKHSKPEEFKNPKEISDHISELLKNSNYKNGDVLNILNNVSHDYANVYVLLNSFIFDDKLLKQLPCLNDFSGDFTIPILKPAKRPSYLEVKTDQVTIPKKKSREVEAEIKSRLKFDRKQLIKDVKRDEKVSQKEAKSLYKAYKLDSKEEKKNALEKWENTFYQEIFRAFFHSDKPHQSHIEINGVIYPLLSENDSENNKEMYFQRLFQRIYYAFGEKSDCESEVKAYFAYKSFPLLNILQTLSFGQLAFGRIAFEMRYPQLFDKRPFYSDKASGEHFALYIRDLNHFCMVRKLNLSIFAIEKKVMELTLNITQTYYDKKWHYTIVPTGVRILDEKLKFALMSCLKIKLPSIETTRY